MSDYLLLRFRDLTPGIDTIKAHNEIVERRDKVLWGWWKKEQEPTPDPGLTNFKDDFREGEKRVLFINSDTRKLYHAPLYRVYYQPGGAASLPPEPELCPVYYETKPVPAWFELGYIEEIQPSTGYLSEYVFSESNRTETRRTITSLRSSDVGQTVTDVEFLDSNVSLWFITHTEDVGIRGRSSIVRPLTTGVWPPSDQANGRYALHISDLHFGEHHHFRNHLAPEGESQFGRETMLEALSQDLEGIGVLDKVALVLVTGDLTWTGESHEFANAEAFFGDLSNRLGLHPSQIVVIPGNHDIEWRDGRGDINPNANLNYSNFCERVYRAEPGDSFLRVQRFKVAGRVICIIGLNSCRLESRENAGLGFVGRAQLSQALRFLRDLDSEGQELRLALVHHHLMPVDYVEAVDWATKRVSLTLDAEDVIRNLIDAKVEMVFHGHNHQPYVSQLRRIMEGFVDFFGREKRLDGQITIVGGGSIGVNRQHLNVVGRNAYNLIDLGGSNFVEIRTRILSAVGPGFIDYQRTRFRTRIRADGTR